jgi:hypothetical protein
MGNQIYFKIAGYVDLDMLNMFAVSTYRKNVRHIMIHPPCNFEVNSITHFGVISLFSSNFQNFNTFRPLFQKL